MVMLAGFSWLGFSNDKVITESKCVKFERYGCLLGSNRLLKDISEFGVSTDNIWKKSNYSIIESLHLKS